MIRVLCIQCLVMVLDSKITSLVPVRNIRNLKVLYLMLNDDLEFWNFERFACYENLWNSLFFIYSELMV